MAKGPVSEADEKKILEALESGRSVRDVGKEFGRSHSTISDVAKRNGLDLADRSETKKAAVAKSCYAAEDRIRLVGELLNKARELMVTCTGARDLQSLAMVIAIGIDKRRLEDGPGNGDKAGEIKKLFEKMRDEEEAES